LRVIIDTDIGDDIDDALALALALRSPELEVEAITTVYGDTRKRCMLAGRLAAAMERDDISVAPGCSKPILEPPPTREPVYFKALDKVGCKAVIADSHAVDVLEELVEEGVSDIITLGPLTNLAVLLLKRPDLAPRIRVVMMGGAWSLKVAEYNFRCDPEAAHIVLESEAAKTLVGLDVTLKCAMSGEMVEQLARGPHEYHRVLASYLDEWARVARHNPILHDPLTVAASFKPGLVRWEDMRLKLELSGVHTRGFLVRVGGEPPNVKTAVDVDEESFLELFRERVIEP